MSPLQSLRARPWLALVPILVVAAIVLLVAGGGSSPSGDDLYYFGRQAYLGDPTPRHFDSLTLEYLLVPYNGHLQIGGKLVYEAVFGLFGADYGALRVVTVAGVLACVALFFELARRRVGLGAALLMSFSLAFLGAAWEVLLWPFDLHTTFAVAAGLGALLALERKGEHADVVACALLIVSSAFIEVGLVFLAAVAVSVLIGPDRWRRAWIFAIPAALFAAWYAWAQNYASPPISIDLGNLIPSLIDSLGAVLSSLTGRFPTGPGVDVTVIGQTTTATVLAIVALVLFAWRLSRGKIPPSLWPVLAALFVYWALIAFTARAADSSRYMFVGAILVLLVAADCLRGRRPGPWALAAIALVVAIALPANIAKLQDGADYLERDAILTGSEFAMLELAGSRGDPDYLPVDDLVALSVGASPYLVMTTGVYLESAERIGSLADPLDRVRGEDLNLRRIDDSTLIAALGLGAEPATAPASEGSCEAAGEATGPIELAPGQGGVLVHADGDEPVALGLSRFAPEAPSRTLGSVEAGGWARVVLPAADDAPEPWQLFVDGPASVCPLV